MPRTRVRLVGDPHLETAIVVRRSAEGVGLSADGGERGQPRPAGHSADRLTTIVDENTRSALIEASMSR